MGPKVLTWNAVALMGVLTAGAALAGGHGTGGWRHGRAGGGFGGGFGGGGFGWMTGAGFHHLIDDLDLSETQKGAVKEALADSFERLEPRLTAAHDARRTLFEAAVSGAPDEAGVRAAGEAVAKVSAELTLEFAHTMATVRGVLTPEQRQELEQILANRREGHEKRAERFRELRRERVEEFLDSL